MLSREIDAILAVERVNMTRAVMLGAARVLGGEAVTPEILKDVRAGSQVEG